jgi:hypothetical protein
MRQECRFRAKCRQSVSRPIRHGHDRAHRARRHRYRDRHGRLQLPLASGRISFVRKVDEHGHIQVNAHSYFVGKPLSRCYVTATIYPQRQEVVIKYERRVHKRYAFPIAERIIAPIAART